MKKNDKNFILDENLKIQTENFLKANGESELFTKIDALKPLVQWTDLTKWGMDIFKSIILWGLVFTFTYFFLNQLEDLRNDKRFRVQKETELKLNSINNFKKTTQKYLFKASDIFYLKDTEYSTYTLFESTYFDDMLLDIDDLKNYYVDKNELIEVVDFKNKIDTFYKHHIKPVIESVRTGKVPTVDKDKYYLDYKELRKLRSSIIEKSMQLNFPKN